MTEDLKKPKTKRTAKQAIKQITKRTAAGFLALLLLMSDPAAMQGFASPAGTLSSNDTGQEAQGEDIRSGESKQYGEAAGENLAQGVEDEEGENIEIGKADDELEASLEAQTQAATPANPVHHCTKEDDGTDCTDFSYVYFGSYPQSEIRDSATIAAIDSAIATSGTVADAGVDVWVNGTKYRRISEDDCNNTYYFDDVENNGYRYFKWERIKWRVLDNNDNGTLFVVADKAIDCKDYNDEYVDITWENSTIRSWLNNSFYQSAFSSAEQRALEPWHVVNEDNPYYDTEGGNDTTDHVYLLSIGEVTNERYGFCSDYGTYSASRWLQPSNYARARGTYTYSSSYTGNNANCWWWLRSPGYYSGSAAYVYDYGDVYRNGSIVDPYHDGAVPALHINLSSDLWLVADDGSSGEGGNAQRVSMPQASTAGGTYTDVQKVAISTATEGTRIYYTIDGTEPSARNGMQYKGEELTITDTTVLKAVAVKEGMSDSEVMTERYRFTYTQHIPVQKMPDFSIGEDQSGEVKDKDVIRFFPGDFSLKMTTIPLTVSSEYDVDGSYTLKVAIGIGKADWLDNNSRWCQYKKLLGELDKAERRMDTLSAFGDGTLKTPLVSSSKFKKKPKISVMGYYEMKIDKNGNIIQQSGVLQGDADWKASKDWQFMTPIGPVYLALSGGAKLTGKLGVKYVMPDGTVKNGKWNLDGSVSVSPNIALEGGYGVAKVATIGAKGNADVKIQLMPSSKGTFGASAAVHVYVIFVYDNEFTLAKYSTDLWDTTGQKNRLAAEGASGTGYRLQAQGDWKPLDRSFAEHTTAWNGALPDDNADMRASSQGELLAAETASQTERQTAAAAVLQSSVMPSCIPLIQSLDDCQVMVFQQNDPDRSTLNSSRLMYSVLQNDMWSEPEPLWDNGTLDAYADMQVIGGELYAIWQKENAVISSDGSDSEAVFAEMAQKSEICISHFDRSTGKFEKPRFITSNQKLDMMPTLAAGKDALTAVWVSNTENDLFGGTGKNQIYTAVKQADGSFGTPELFYETEQQINEIQAVPAEDSLAVAAVLADNEQDGRLMLISASGEERELTDGNAQVCGLEYGGGYLTYIEEGNLMAYDFTSMDVQMMNAQDTAVTGNASIFSRNGKTAILYSSAQEKGSQVFAAIKSGEDFGEPVVLYETEDQIRYMDAVLNADGTWNLLMNQGEITGLEEVHSLVYVGTEPVEQVSLDMLMVEDVADEDGTIPIFYAVTNTNEKAIDRLHLQIRDAEGNLIKEQEIPVDLASGQNMQDSVRVQIDGLDQIQKASVSIYADDQSAAENAQTMTLNPTDLSVSANMVAAGDDVTIVATVANDSMTASDAVLSVYGDVERTNQLEERQLGVLQPGESQTCTFYLDKKTFTATGNAAYYLPVAAASSVEDINEDNNAVIKVVYDAQAEEEGEQKGDPSNPGISQTQNPTNGEGDAENDVVANDVPVSSLSIKAPSKKLAAGKKVKLSVDVKPLDAKDQSVTWEISNKKYASINQSGKLTLKKAGAGKTVTITATANDGSGVKASYKIKIMKHAVKSVKLSAASKTVSAGKSVKIKAAVKTTGKNANKALKWSSSNQKYATVNSKGLVKTKKAGKGKTVTITAMSTDGSNKKTKVKIKIK